jgi:hypothetical protein
VPGGTRRKRRGGAEMTPAERDALLEAVTTPAATSGRTAGWLHRHGTTSKPPREEAFEATVALRRLEPQPISGPLTTGRAVLVAPAGTVSGQACSPPICVTEHGHGRRVPCATSPAASPTGDAGAPTTNAAR